MEYWRGQMNWPVDRDWACPTCGKDATWLEWGLIHSQCRCSNCHTQFYMRDENEQVVTVPICYLKDEYKEPARAGFEYFKKPISQFNDDEWDYAFSLVAK